MVLVAAFILYAAALVLVCWFGLRKGGAPERQTATALLVAVAATQIADALGSGWQRPEYGIMAVDLAFLIALIVIAEGSERFWPIWAAAAQLTGLITHLVVVAHPQVPSDLYRATQPFWAFPILGGIAWGTWTNRARSLKSR